jgi:hypothetical protein
VAKFFFIMGIFLLVLPALKITLLAQVRVTGHVFAEVVETVGAAANTNDWVVITHDNVSSEFELGNLSINGGAMAAYDLVIETNEMTGETGTHASFLATTDYGNQSYMLDARGKQVFRLYGSASNISHKTKEKHFSANYQITFAYN